MRYEHTITAILSLVIGLILLVCYIFDIILGFSFSYFEYLTSDVLIEFLQHMIYFGYAISPILIAVGYLGIRREFEIRDLERGANRIHQVNRKSAKAISNYSRTRKRGHHFKYTD